MMFACCDKSLFQRFFSWFVHSNGGTEARPSKWPKWEVFQIRLILLAMTSFHPFPLQAVSYCISCGCTFLYVYEECRPERRYILHTGDEEACGALACQQDPPGICHWLRRERQMGTPGLEIGSLQA